MGPGSFDIVDVDVGIHVDVELDVYWGFKQMPTPRKQTVRCSFSMPPRLKKKGQA